MYCNSRPKNPGPVRCYNYGKTRHVQRTYPKPPKIVEDAPCQPTKGQVFSIVAPDAGRSGDVVQGKEQE